MCLLFSLPGIVFFSRQHLESTSDLEYRPAEDTPPLPARFRIETYTNCSVFYKHMVTEPKNK